MPQSVASAPRAESNDNPLFRREMRERWRRPLTIFQLALFAGILSWLAYSFYLSMVPQGSVDTNSLSGAGRNFFFAVAQLHALAWIPGGLLLAAPTLAAERERGHLFEWILAGLTPTNIVRAKFRALAGFVLVMVCVPFPIFALCFPLGGVSPLDFLSIGVLTVVIALDSVAFGVLLSATAARVTGAIVGALVSSAGFLALSLPILNLVIGNSWQMTLLMALGLSLLCPIWLAAAQSWFEVEVEKHIKGESEFVAEHAQQDAQRLMIGPYGRLEPPIFEADSASERADERASKPVSKPAWSAPREPETRGVESWSETELLILQLAERNAIAQRDVRRKFASRQQSVTDVAATSTSLWVWLTLWLFIGGGGLLLIWLAPDGALFQLSASLVLAPAMAQVALGAASGFTRERAQRMLSALQMTALSPADIVWGKVGGALLLCAQNFGGLLLALCLMAFSYGPRSALMMAIFGVSCVAFTAMGSLTLSLWSRKTEIVALGALASIVALWWVVPTLYTNAGDIFHAPVWLEVLWLRPLRVFSNPASDLALALALLQLSVICAAGTLILGGLCIRQLRRTRAEEEATGLLQRDLSRGWR